MSCYLLLLLLLCINCTRLFIKSLFHLFCVVLYFKLDVYQDDILQIIADITDKIVE